jgi:hypothetical protein
MKVRPRAVAAASVLLWVQVALGPLPFIINAFSVDWTATNALDGSGTASAVNIFVLVFAATATVVVLVVPIILLRRASRWTILASALAAAWGVYGALQTLDPVISLRALTGVISLILLCLHGSRSFLRATRSRVAISRQEKKAFSQRLPRIR